MNRILAPLLAALALVHAACATTRPASADETASSAPVASPPAARPSKETVALRFGWPDGFSARVAFTKSKVRNGQKMADGTTSYTLRAERRGEELVVRSEDYRWEGDQVAGMEAALQAASLVRMVVGTDGTFRGTEGTSEGVAALSTVVPAPPERRAAMEKMMAQAMTAELEELWRLMVGYWNGADLAVGEAYRTRDEASIPMAAGATVHYDVEFGARERVACQEGETEKRCVELYLHSVPDPADLPGLMKSLLSQVLAASGAGEFASQLTVESQEMVNDVVLVTDPATLRPYLLTKKKVLKGVFAHPKADKIEMNQTDQVTYRFEYTP